MGIIAKIFGTKNERTVRKMQPLIEQIGRIGSSLEAKDDEALRAMTGELKQRLENGATLDHILPDAFALVREAGVRVLGMRHYDVQLIGGMVLHRGQIAEMRTGEGKTLVATLPAYLNALEGKGIHVVTVNDYLAKRDAEWMGRLYNFLGMSVGVVVHGLDDTERQRAYRSDITYGQNNEFGFDYLRDNMKQSPDRMGQRGHHYAIVDEVDSILIDEARTPLIISGPAEQSADLYLKVNKIIPRLKRDIDYTVDEEAHSTMLTDLGVERVEKLLELDNLYDPANLQYNHHVQQALRAHTLYKRDVNYLLENSKVIIIDDFTGRKMPGRRWSDGLHQAIEAKEGVTIEEENQTLATVTFQNYFRLYKKLSGMTGTADTEAAEFHEIYKLDVAVIPTNRPIQRADQPDLVYKNERGKFRAVLEDILECHGRGQPVLVGTVSVEKSEVLSHELKQREVPFHVLNAKQHEREAAVVAQAGRKGAITISTNMAGRGTDIILGGNAEAMAKEALARELAEAGAESNTDRDARLEQLIAQFKEQCNAEREEVLASGGLKIIGTERHESRRIDNQLRGRAGRQGDPGASAFYLSLEDDLLRIFGGERMTNWMERLGMEEDVPIEHSWLTKSIENAQKKVEGRNFDSRKNVLEYDDVMNQQRKTVYNLRRQILEGRYEPTLSEDELKAGRIPEPPTTSGDWTIESVSAEIRPKLVEFVNRVLDKIEERDRSIAEAGANGENADTPAGWRVLRSELWRTNGALLELEGKLSWPREKLHDYIVREVAHSHIMQRERLLDLSDAMIGQIVDAHCGPGTDDWDFDAIEAALSDAFNCKITVDRRAAEPLELAESAWEQVQARIAQREEELGAVGEAGGRAWLMYFVRHFFLEEIDQQWIEHLKVMDHLRQGIGLRGYGQKDPKKEYKKEGFDLFGEMMQRIQSNAADKIFKVMLQPREEARIPSLEAKQRQMLESHPPAGTNGAANEAAASGEEIGNGAQAAKPQTVRREQPKVGRNDPCPCGSGKKYKKCHGRTGAEASA